MKLVIAKNQPKPGERTAIPLWMTDTEYPAPCPCGFPADDESVLCVGETGLKRMMHMRCMSFDMLDDDD